MIGLRALYACLRPHLVEPKERVSAPARGLDRDCPAHAGPGFRSHAVSCESLADGYGRRGRTTRRVDGVDVRAVPGAVGIAFERSSEVARRFRRASGPRFRAMHTGKSRSRRGPAQTEALRD